MANIKRRLVVKNIQRYRIGRGGVVFQPGKEREVVTDSDQQYREIKACVYLHILKTELLDGAPAAAPVDTKPKLPAHVIKYAEAARIADLRDVAEAHELSKAGSKLDIAARLYEGGWDPGEADDEDDDEDPADTDEGQDASEDGEDGRSEAEE